MQIMGTAVVSLLPPLLSKFYEIFLAVDLGTVDGDAWRPRISQPWLTVPSKSASHHHRTTSLASPRQGVKSLRGSNDHVGLPKGEIPFEGVTGTFPFVPPVLPWVPFSPP